jgi:putative membrane protein
MGYWHDGRGFDVAWLFFGVLWIVLLVLLAALVFRLIAGRRGWVARGPGTWPPGREHATLPGSAVGPEPAAGPPAARLILDERLARGEIDVETYRSIRAELEGGNPPPPPPG